jgi:hypothetical protein
MKTKEESAWEKAGAAFNATVERNTVQALIRWVDHHDAVEALTDADLSDAVLNEVWAQISLCSKGEVLLNEMMTRFDKRCGIVRDEEGEIVK